ncbi:hypothetical protein [Salinibacillus xinjiangensis]|uniref:Uncharacterized protein n=1 Tax=Salinibacillus xinjiangensis TaxID=1229268 RepID=A0A6G1XAE5_9BACI|nr:hypothetical protein [Salinibacillus xinjiangensis]MRG87758.1 hypothetical protein [Salinibacillus xinjiangensis]
MRTDAIIFVTSCIIIAGVITLFSFKHLKNKDYAVNKSVLIIPSITFAVAIGIVISIMANGTFLESLVVIGVMLVMSLGYSFGLIRMRKSFQSFCKKDGSK